MFQFDLESFREVFSLGNFNEIKYYLEECENQNLSVRELHFKIKTKEYERLSKKVKQKNLKLMIYYQIQL